MGKTSNKFRSMTSQTGTFAPRPRTAATAAFSLVELMVSAAVGAIVMGGIATWQVHQQETTQSLNQKSELNNLASLMRYTTNTEAQCLTIFSGSGVDLTGSSFNINGGTTTTQTLSQITIPSMGNKVINPSSATLRYITPGLRVTSLTLERPGTSLGSDIFQGWLVITASRQKGNSNNAKDVGPPLTKRVPIALIDSTSDGNADSCRISTTAGAVGSSTATPPRNEIIVATAEPGDFTGTNCSAIQSALTAASASTTARSVLIKGGNYTNCADLAITGNNVVVRGEGSATVLVGDSSPTTGIFNVTGSGVTISELQINQNSVSNGKPGVYGASTAHNLKVDQVTFRNTGTAVPGIFVTTAGTLTGLQFTRNVFGSPTSTAEAYVGVPIAIDQSGALQDLRISENRAFNGEGAGGLIYVGSDLTRAIIENNHFATNNDTTNYGIGFENANSPAVFRDVAVVNNHITLHQSDGETSAGIYFESGTLNAANISIKGNAIKYTGTTPSTTAPMYGIWLNTSDATNGYGSMTITENQINCGANGMGASDLGAGINVTRSVATLVKNNVIDNCVTAINATNSRLLATTNVVRQARKGIVSATHPYPSVAASNRLINVQQGVALVAARSIATNNYIDFDQSAAANAANTLCDGTGGAPAGLLGVAFCGYSYSQITDNFINPACDGTNYLAEFSIDGATGVHMSNNRCFGMGAGEQGIETSASPTPTPTPSGGACTWVAGMFDVRDYSYSDGALPGGPGGDCTAYGDGFLFRELIQDNQAIGGNQFYWTRTPALDFLCTTANGYAPTQTRLYKADGLASFRGCGGANGPYNSTIWSPGDAMCSSTDYGAGFWYNSYPANGLAEPVPGECSNNGTNNAGMGIIVKEWNCTCAP